MIDRCKKIPHEIRKSCQSTKKKKASNLVAVVSEFSGCQEEPSHTVVPIFMNVTDAIEDDGVVLCLARAD